MPRDKVLEWLLEPDQPSIRYLALTQLPEPSPEADRWYAEHPGNKRPTPLAFETARRPSKMITLRALTVLSRVG